MDARPKVGDTVRVEGDMWGSVIIEDFTLEELNYCLGFYRSECPKVPSAFVPLSELMVASPDASREYYSHFGEYFSDYVRTFEIIRN